MIIEAKSLGKKIMYSVQRIVNKKKRCLFIFVYIYELEFTRKFIVQGAAQRLYT